MSRRMDRVVRAETVVVLLISGRITGEDVDLLRRVLEQESGSFAIDLKNVLLVDRELRNCPPYIREWVTRERTMHGRPSQQGQEGREEIDDA
jgi:hypothetical protein